MLGLLAAISCVGGAGAEDPLEWIADADPVAAFERDVAEGTLYFLAVCGFSCQVVGVSSITHQQCFASVPVEEIGGTSDVIRSERHQELQARAEEYARRYNALVRTKLEVDGRTRCAPGEDWGGALGALNVAARAATPKPPFAWASGSQAGAYDFRVHHPELPSDRTTLRRDICRDIARHGISRPTRVNLTVGATRNAISEPFGCENGAVRP